MSTYEIEGVQGDANRCPNFPKIPAEGLFGPKSIAWMVNREQVTLLAGPAAAVLQIAHPKVARGVAEHSDFRKDSYGRLKRTLSAVRSITFGTGRDVYRVALGIQKMHERVMAKQSNTDAGYSALDSDLQLWVLATLIKGAVSNYELFVSLLSADEKHAYYQDMRAWGQFFGLSTSYGPRNWEEFEDYYATILHGNVLGSDPICAEVARQVVYPEHPLLFKLGTLPLSYLVTENLPPPLLERLGLRSERWTRTAWSVTKTLVPTVYSLLPDALRYPVEYRRARTLWN